MNGNGGEASPATPPLKIKAKSVVFESFSKDFQTQINWIQVVWQDLEQYQQPLHCR